MRQGRIPRLRRRFVAYAMAAVACVLVLIGLAVNLSYGASTMQDVDTLLELIASGQGSLPAQRSFTRTGERGTSGATKEDRGTRENTMLEDISSQSSTEDEVDSEAELENLETSEDSSDTQSWLWDEWDSVELPFGVRPLTPETAYATRWFSVTYDGTGQVAWVDLSHIASVNQEDLPRFVEVAAQQGDGFGSLGDYRYLVLSSTGYHQAYFLDATNEFYALRTLGMLTWAVGIAAFGLISVLVWVLAGRAVRPVAEADARQRRFITDASHELKTPLAVILTSLGVAEMEVGENRWVDKATKQTHRMAELVDELVTFARIDEGEDRAPALFDASAATLEVAEGFEDHAAEQGHHLRLEIAEGLGYTGDEYGYRRMVSVLLDNAVKYAAPGGPITLTLERYKRHGLRLRCENPAEGLEAAELPHLFERFWRPDDSRSRETGGFGIGLSIAREVAEQAGGTITATLPVAATEDSPALIRFEALLP